MAAVVGKVPKTRSVLKVDQNVCHGGRQELAAYSTDLADVPQIHRLINIDSLFPFCDELSQF